ncbi:Rho GTPase activation protein, partial [Coemansia spiralis]
FANTQFAAQKRGFLRRKVPLDEMISYTSETIARPLMNLPREMIRDAVRSFRVIQRFMGNIDGEVSPKEKFSEILWLANKGIRNQVLRDEIFCQLSKQTTGNPSPTAVEKGWMLMGVLLYAFRPTQLMFPHLEAFVDSAAIPTVMLRRFLHLQMNRAKRAGGRTAEMSSKELRLAMTVPSRPLLFGGSLSEIMADPELVNRKTGLPKILELLTGLIISLGGESTEGLFRVPGDSDTVAMARLQFEAGHPDFSQIRDPNVPASLLKEWLRDLAEPLIPESFYDRCMSTPEDPEIAMEVLDVLPEPSLKVVKYLLKFFAHLLQPSVQAKTKMDSSNLALVFGPSLLRNPVNDLKDMFANLSGEQRFVLTLI